MWDYELAPIVSMETPETVAYLLVSALEVTDQVRARKNLEQLEQLRDDFLALATHELRSPMTSIQGNAQMLQMTLKRYVATLSQEQARQQRLDQGLTQVDHILHQITSMNSLVTEMMDVTRMRGEVFALNAEDNIDLVALVRKVVEQQANQDHEVNLKFEEEAILLTLDKDRIEQVLNNLLSNAFKYSAPGTPIKVTLERRQDTNEVVVAVQDRGKGIQKEDQAHLFERFYRATADRNRRTDGVGLGLYIASTIVERHGGRIWLESEPGQGSTFFFALPFPRNA